jgi:hypothetical protein
MKGSVKEKRVEHFENVLKWGKAIEKYLEKNEKVCETLEVKEGLFCEEELETFIKRLRNSKVSNSDSVVNNFF